MVLPHPAAEESVAARPAKPPTLSRPSARLDLTGSEDYVLAIDHGNPPHLVRCGWPGAQRRSDGADPVLSAARLDRARSRGDLAERRVDLPRGGHGRRCA